MLNNRQLNKRIGQIQATQFEVEDSLTDEEFQDYCDAATTCIQYLKDIQNKLPKN
jgi:hypothetical protein